MNTAQQAFHDWWNTVAALNPEKSRYEFAREAWITSARLANQRQRKRAERARASNQTSEGAKP